MENGLIHILLADDDEDDRTFFKEAFEEIKIETKVTLVNDGVELMNHLKRNGHKKPHILFLDLNMPRKNGMECLLEIRNSRNLKDIPIAIYSTSSAEEDIEETFVKGANVYIRKPNDFTELKKILEEVITINWQYHTSGLNREIYLLNR
jgi:CheY-like chemotaxis protein